MVAQVILFQHANFHGAHKHVFVEEANLNAGDDNSFNDQVFLYGDCRRFLDFLA